MAGKQEVKTPLLSPARNGATMQDNLQIVVNRADLEKEHSLLIARLHLLRKQLGYQPLTQKEERRQK
jgi:hypothetical protein